MTSYDLYAREAGRDGRAPLGRVPQARQPGGGGRHARRGAGAEDGWLPSGAAVSVAGYEIYGGLLYVGSAAAGYPGGGADPALIDPALPVGLPPDRAGDGLDYWPAYDRIPPPTRAAYLEWLARGRCDPQTPIGFVFLYFYGLERRVVADCARPGAARGELPAIRAEVERLLGLYGANSSFHHYATGLLALIDLIEGTVPGSPPEFAGQTSRAPLGLRLRLGEFVLEGRPIPADWALAWAWFHPDITLRTPAWRCPQEFTRLFALRYAAAYGGGLSLAPDVPAIAFEYQTASAALGTATWLTDVPDVFAVAAPTRALAAFAEECCDALDAYSRRRAADDDADGGLAAAALLPPELVDRRHGPAGRLIAWVADRLGGAEAATVDGAELAGAWGSGDRAALTKPETAALGTLLAGQGVGMEPDPRYGGRALAAGPVVLFRSRESDAASAPSDAYRAAAAMVHLAAAVATADRSSAAEQTYLMDRLQSAFRLSPGEHRRLAAHLHRLLLNPVKLTGLTARLAGLTAQQRAAVASFCVAVAAADAVIAADEVAVLTKIYRLLGLTHEQLMADIRGAAVTAPPAPGRSRDAPESAVTTAQPAAAPATGVVLDQAVIAAKLAEAAEVGALLESIFADDDTDGAADADTPPPPPTPATPRPDAALIAGLDAAHSALVRRLAAEPTWPRGAVEDLCAGLGLLPDGALETVNDAAIDRCGEPVAEGHDPLEINTDAMQEILR